MGGLVSVAIEATSCLACSCFMWLFDATLAQASRFGHILVIIVTFGLACFVGREYSQQVSTFSPFIGDIRLGNNCNSVYSDDCIYRQLVYRASLSLFLLFLLTTSLSFFTDSSNKSFWVMKFVFALGLFVAFWWIDDSTFAGWSNFARFVSFAWLLVQGLLVLDFAHDIHDVIMRKAEDAEQSGNSSRVWYALYLLVSFSALAVAVTGLVYLFRDYFGCERNQFFIGLTLAAGIITLPVSLLNIVNKGLLTPCVIFSYSVFLCWYAVVSSPDSACNASANATADTAAFAITLMVSSATLLYCVFFGTAILNVFNTQTEYSVLSSSLLSGHEESDASASQSQSRLTGIERPRTGGDYGTRDTGNDRGGDAGSGGTKHEIVFFHALMMLVACYGSMALTNWGAADGSTLAASAVTASQSLWLKIVSQWIFLLIFCRTLQLAYYENS